MHGIRLASSRALTKVSKGIFRLSELTTDCRLGVQSAVSSDCVFVLGRREPSCRDPTGHRAIDRASAKQPPL